VDGSDAELIARVLRHDDRAAYGELVQRHQSAVRRFLRCLTRGDDALADDLAQETFVTAYRSLTRFHGTASLTTWLLGIARNQHRNATRRQRTRNEIPDADRELAAMAADGADTRTSDLRHDLDAALRQLSPDEQLALHLGFQQGLSHAEIANVTAWPLGTTKTHLARGKDKLRQLLSAWNR
jgi:RNA polymerase sigma-70 factor (ECF subfamily)